MYVTSAENGSSSMTTYNASDGARLWTASYDGRFSTDSPPVGLKVSPDGTKVYATGGGYGTSSDWGTVAYRASDGTQLWVARYSPVSISGGPSGFAMSADGTRLYVTGNVRDNSDVRYTTVAYDTSDGAQLWVALYNYDNFNSSVDEASTIGVSLDGTKVFVTGPSFNATGSTDYATVAYDASDGTQLWVMRYNTGLPGALSDIPRSLGVSPDGTKVYVTGTAETRLGEYATVAYDAVNGTQLWVALYGEDDTYASASSLAVSPDGLKVYVTGWSAPPSSAQRVFTTVAYDTSAGSQLWVAMSKVGAQPFGIVVSPNGRYVYVTGYGLKSGSAAASDAYGTSDGSWQG
ncbi:MAG TPA: hypothetical protein VIK54_08385, partial [Acidimicrobiia bacterium]